MQEEKIGQFFLMQNQQASSSAPLTNVAMENPPVMYVDVTRTVSIMLAIVLNNSIFLLAFHRRQSHPANIPQFQLIIQAIYFLVFQGHRV